MFFCFHANFSGQEDLQKYNLPIAVAVVMSGQYEDDIDNVDDVVYTGQGGHDLLGSKLQQKDQKLVGGNLALKVSDLELLMLCV